MHFAFNYCCYFWSLKISLTHLFLFVVFVVPAWFICKGRSNLISLCRNWSWSGSVPEFAGVRLVFWGRGRRNIDVKCSGWIMSWGLLWLFSGVHELVDNTINWYLTGCVNIRRWGLLASLIASRRNFVIYRAHFIMPKNNKFINYTIWSNFHILLHH